MRASLSFLSVNKMVVAVLATGFLAAGSAAQADIKWVAFGGNGWEVDPVVTGNYDSVACMTTSPLFGAKSNGGVDYVSWNQTWGAANVVASPKYVDLSIIRSGSAQNLTWAVNASGGVDWVDGSGHVDNLLSGNYISVADRDGNSFYAAKATGGIDLVGWNPNTYWQGSDIGVGSTRLVDIAPSSNYGFIWGVTAAGGIDYFDWNGNWSDHHLLDGNYVSICANTQVDNVAYAALATGGIDKIEPVNGVWTATRIINSSTVFTDLAADVYRPYAGLMYATTAAVPEPSTLVLLVSGLVGLLAYAWRKRR